MKISTVIGGGTKQCLQYNQTEPDHGRLLDTRKLSIKPHGYPAQQNWTNKISWNQELLGKILHILILD
jgi:hypothetical protein